MNSKYIHYIIEAPANSKNFLFISKSHMFICTAFLEKIITRKIFSEFGLKSFSFFTLNVRILRI